MEQKKMIMFGMLLGSVAGGFIPTLWEASIFSLSSVVFSALGGFLGIYLGYKVSL